MTTTLTTNDDCFGTPDFEFNKLHLEFNFTIDVATDGTNSKLPRFFTETQDGLAQSWAGERVFCNPPYSKGKTVPWIYKAHEEVTNGDCVLAVLLIPGSRCEQAWFQDIVRPFHDHRHVRGRIKFIGGASQGLKPSMICIFRNRKYLMW